MAAVSGKMTLLSSSRALSCNREGCNHVGLHTPSLPSQLRYIHWLGSDWRYPEGMVRDHKERRRVERRLCPSQKTLYHSGFVLGASLDGKGDYCPNTNYPPFQFHFLRFWKQNILIWEDKEDKDHIPWSKKIHRVRKLHADYNFMYYKMYTYKYILMYIWKEMLIKVTQLLIVIIYYCW